MPPLPRPKRQRHRAEADRGLPLDSELSRLAEYLRVQGKHWPEIVKAGLLPEATDDAVAGMVEDFKNRHRTGHVSPSQVQGFLRFCKKLAGSYNRYSCENSSPNSIIDQMVKGLDKAREEDRFVAWAYVFCDYSVSGLNASRLGYASYKRLLQDKEQLIETTYIDDFTRASRDEIEWWKLASMSKRLMKRMIGASDGFDLSAVDWDIRISLYGLLSRLFIKQLRQKVLRGQHGAARRGTCVGRPSLGFTRCVQLDQNGNVVVGADGHPTYRLCIDPATRDSRILLYELFVEKCWSTYRIVQHFNSMKVDGWDGWTEGGIKKTLWSASAIGVLIWNRNRREFDHEENKWVKVTNPRKEWEVSHHPDLAIVPVPLWAAARKKLSNMRRASPLTGRKSSRNEKSASTMFSGTLFCGDCGRELVLLRSAGKYKVMGCINGPTGKYKCTQSTTKSTRIIETCLLSFLQDRLLTEDVIEKLVAKANAFLLDEAKKPRVNTTPLKASIRKKEAAIKKWFERTEGSEDEAFIQASEKRISELQREVNELRGQLRVAETQNEPPPAPLDLAVVKALLTDLRGLLNQEIPAAAEALRALTGPIAIRQEKVPGRTRGAKWIATFSPDLVGWLRQRAKVPDCPDSVTLEYLSKRIWTTPEKLEVSIDHVPKHEVIAEEAAEMLAKGTSINTVAAALDVARETVRQTMGIHRKRDPRLKKRSEQHLAVHRKRLVIDVAEVLRLRDTELLPFTAIAQRLGVSSATVVRLYDRGNPRASQEAAKNGARPRRGRYSRLGPELLERIREGLGAGQRREQIAKNCGCSLAAVYLVYRQMYPALKDIRADADSGGKKEWLLSELAGELRVSGVTLDGWRQNGWLLGRQIAGPRTRWLLWADASELVRLRQLHRLTRRHAWPYPLKLTIPKQPKTANVDTGSAPEEG